WITINGNLHQTGTIGFTSLDSVERTRVDFSLDYGTFYEEADEEMAKFIKGLQALMKKDIQRFKQEEVEYTITQDDVDTLAEMEAAIGAAEEEEEEAAA